MPWKNRMDDDEQPEVEGHRKRYIVSDEPEVEGHAGKIRFLDQRGNRFEIPEERIRSVKWTDAEGEHEVEGRKARFTLTDEPDTEGHSARIRWLSDQPLTIKFLDEKGEEQEVEGHLSRFSDLRLKQNVSTLDGALARLGSIRTS